MKIKPLVWEMHPAEDGHILAKSETIIGTYFICYDNDDFSGLYCDFVSVRDATWFGTGRVISSEVFSGIHYDEHEFEDSVFPLVQKHFDEKINSTLCN